MLVSGGPIALAKPGWSLKPDTVTSVVGDDSGGYPEVLCAQILLAAATSGLKVLVLLPGARDDEPTWAAINRMLGGPGGGRTAAGELRHMKLLMYALGTGREHAGKADLVYAPGLRSADLERLVGSTSAPILTLTDLDSEVMVRRSGEVIRVGSSTIVLDGEGFEIPVMYDPDGPVYRPA